MLIVSKRKEKVCREQKIFKPKTRYNIDRLFLDSKTIGVKDGGLT
jgi:hypothetical protein